MTPPRAAILAVLAIAAVAHPAPAQPIASPRVVSLSPALTQMIFDMGLGDHVVGVSNYCSLPPGVDLPRLGDQKTFNLDRIVELQPEMVLTQSESEHFAGLRAVAPGIEIERFEVESLEDIPAAMQRIARLLGSPERGEAAAQAFRDTLAEIAKRAEGLDRPRVLFVMGTDRPSVAAPGSFIDGLIRTAGAVNAAADIPGPANWRDATLEAIHNARPDVIICQVFDEDRIDDARRYWLSLVDLPAARRGRVFVTADRGWTIPTGRIADRGIELVDDLRAVPREPLPPRATRTLREVQFWRMIAVAVVGASLAVAGLGLQGLLRNPLAEPYLLGISSGAGVGVLAGLALAGHGILSAWMTTPALAFFGALAACVVVYLIAQRRGHIEPYTIILAGVIVNAFNGAIMLTIYLFIDPYRIPDFARWNMGQVPEMVDLTTLGICFALMAVGWAVLLVRAKALNTLGLGDAVAASSGVAVGRLRIEVFAAASLMTAATVALVGPIGFVGLIIPHITRMLLGPDHRRNVIAAALLGAGFLLGAEALCRAAGPALNVGKVPVGILCALCGGPFFILLLRRRGRETRV